MKKLKIKKCMTSFLMLAVMAISFIGIIPTAKVYAGTFLSLETTKLDDEGKPVVYKGFTEHDVYQFQAPGHSDVSMICVYSPYEHGSRLIYIFLSEDRDFTSVKVNRVSDNGDIANYTLTEHGTVSNHIKSFNYVYTEIIGGHYDFKFNAISKVTTAEEIDSHGPEQAKYVKYYVDNFVNYGDEWATIDGNTEQIPDGSADKPYKTDKLGTLVDMEKHYRSYVEMGNSDTSSIVTERTHHWGWNKKTSTGLNLLDNDSFDSIETYCYIKFYDVYKKNWITGSKEELSTDKFKKLYFISKCDASKLELEVKQTDVLDDEMIKELKSIGDSLGAYDLTHEMVYSYDFYFQLVGCKNGKYYKGGYVHFKKDGSAEEILGGKFDVSTNTADEDENGDIKDNDDSETGTGVTGTGDNYDDAKNNADAVINKTDDNSSGLDVASIKSFMSEVGNVPKAIGKLFSFLPTWVTTFIGFGFVVLIALIIIKTIRG